MPESISEVEVTEPITNEKLRELLKDAIREKNIAQKWKKFEIFFETLMKREKDFEFVRKHCRSSRGEIDYIYSHNLVYDSFWKKSPYICVECKNWKGKINSRDMDHFISLVKSMQILCCYGVYITTSSYEKSAYESIKNAKNDGILIIPIEKKHLKRLIEEGFKNFVKKLGQEVVFKM